MMYHRMLAMLHGHVSPSLTDCHRLNRQLENGGPSAVALFFFLSGFLSTVTLTPRIAAATAGAAGSALAG